MNHCPSFRRLYDGGGRGVLEDSSWLCRPGLRGTSRMPVPRSRKWAKWCLVSLGLSVGGVCGGIGWCLPPLLFRVGSGVASPELSVRDVDARSIYPLLISLGIVLRTSCLIRLSPGLSVRDVVRAAEVSVRRALGIGSGVVIGREWGSSPILITLVLSPELSLGDVGKAARGDVMLTPSISIGGGWM